MLVPVRILVLVLVLALVLAPVLALVHLCQRKGGSSLKWRIE